MTSVSTCPHCGQRVSIPAELDPQGMVRCPICEAEFPLSLALVNAVEAPPELVPVAQVTGPIRDTAVGLATPPGMTREEEASGGKAASPSDPSSPGAASPGVSAGAEGKSDPAGARPPVDTAALERAMEAEQGPAHGLYRLAGDPPAREASAMPSFTHVQTGALWRSRQKTGSSLGAMGKAVAIVVGGFLGVAVAYFFLSIIHSKFDFLHLIRSPTRPNNAVAPPPEVKESGPSTRGSKKFNPNDPSFPPG